MYRPDTLQNELLHLIGWRQNYDTGEFTIDESLTASLTGQYFQDFHPMLTLDNMKAVAPDFSRIEFVAWDSQTQYAIGDRVSHGGDNYIAITSNLNEAPTANPNNWRLFDGFSDWLEQKTKDGIAKAIRRFWTEKLEEKTAKNIIENKALFDGAGRITDVITETGNWVGLEIVPLRSQGITLQLNKIGLQFKGVGTVRLYLLHSSKKEIVSSIDCEITRDSSFHWFNQTDLFLPYIGDETDAGGSWYLIYNQDDLPEGMQAINKAKDWSKTPCSTCNGSQYQIWQTLSRHLEVHPFKVPAKEIIELWDVADNLYTYTKNYGINLQLGLSCDVTDIIVQQAKSFQNVIGLQVVENMLKEFLYNPNFRIGRTQQNFSKQEIRYELEGDPQAYKKSGVSFELTRAMNGLKLDVTKLSRNCFQTNNGGIRYRGI